MDKLVVSISRHPVVSATDQKMAPGALCDYNLDFIRFEVSLFIAFDKFVHVIFYFSYFTSSTGFFFIGFVFKALNTA